MSGEPLAHRCAVEKIRVEIARAISTRILSTNVPERQSLSAYRAAKPRTNIIGLET